MKKTTKWVIGVCVAIVFLIIIAKPSQEDLQPTPTPISTPIVKTGSFVKDTYMEGCLEGAIELDFDGYDYCECTYDHMLDSMGIEDFMSMAVEYEKTNEFSIEMSEAINECSYLVD